MSFGLFGFDFIPKEGIYAIWIGCITNADNGKRSLLCLHNWRGKEFMFDLFWVNLIK